MRAAQPPNSQGALEKLEGYSKRVPMNVQPAQASHFIVNPLGARKVAFANAFRTHPTTEERVRRLRALDVEQGAGRAR